MSYDQVAEASGRDDASSGGASQGGRGIRRAFWFSHNAFWNSLSEFGCAKWVRRSLIISHNKLAQQIRKANSQTKFLHSKFTHEFRTQILHALQIFFFSFSALQKFRGVCEILCSQGVRKFRTPCEMNHEFRRVCELPQFSGFFLCQKYLRICPTVLKSPLQLIIKKPKLNQTKVKLKQEIKIKIVQN